MESVIREDGTADPNLDPSLGLDRRRELFADMVRTRAIDERLSDLADDGDIGFFPSARGREAAVIGTVGMFSETDWVFGTHADWPAAVHRKMPLARLVHRVFGSAEDPLLGHDAPTGFSDRRRAIASVSAPAATHLPHAVGVAYAARLKKRDLVTLALFDAREIDAADFHTGLNFAGVMKTATLFVCMTRDASMLASDHAEAYGLPGISCDGTDLLAVAAAVRSAYEQASIGRGATVIDLVLGGDDDAMDKTRKHLARLGGFTAEEERALSERVRGELDAAISEARASGLPAASTMFDAVYRLQPAHLVAQSDLLNSINRNR